MRPHLNALSVPQGLGADDHLHYAPLVDVAARGDQLKISFRIFCFFFLISHLKDVGGGVIMSEVLTLLKFKFEFKI